MIRFSKIISFVFATLLVSARAYAEFLPIDGEDQLIAAEEAKPVQRRRRGPPEQESEAAQRAKIENYLDQQGLEQRAVETRANTGRRGYRYNAETGYADTNAAPARDYSADGRRAERAKAFTREPAGERSQIRAFSGDSPADAIFGESRGVRAQEAAPQAEPSRKQRWRVEEPVWNVPAPKAKAEVAPNYPFDSQSSPSNFGAAFEKPKGNKTRQALLNVKKWMRQEDEKAARLSAENEDEDSSPTEFTARIGLLGGMSNLKSSDQSATTEAAPANLFLGLFSDVNLGQYFGAEVEGFYGIAPSLNEVTVGADGTTQSETMRSVQHMGGMIDMKVRYALPLGSVTVIPKFGIGYGLLSLTAKATTTAGEDSLKQSTSGLYWTAGVDIIPSDSFSLGIDYAASLSASGSATQVTAGASTSRAIEGAGFNRLRLGAYVKVFPKISRRPVHHPQSHGRLRRRGERERNDHQVERGSEPVPRRLDVSAVSVGREAGTPLASLRRAKP